MSGLLNIGVSGLRAQQAALNIVGQNITNASTPGYTRQRVDLAAEISGANSSVFAGAGVGVQGITRVVDEFVSEQIRTDTAMFSELSSFNENVRTIESSLFDSRFGIDAALNEFFSALQSAANQPADLGLREFVLSSAEAVVETLPLFLWVAPPQKLLPSQSPEVRLVVCCAIEKKSYGRHRTNWAAWAQLSLRP